MRAAVPWILATSVALLWVAAWVATPPEPAVEAEPEVAGVEEPAGDVDFSEVPLDTADLEAPDGIPSGPELHIVDWPIPYGDERKRLTADYLRMHTGEENLTGDLDADSTMVPRLIVLHWTAGPTAKSAWWAFAPERSRRKVDPEQAVNLSTQFVVDRDGTVFRLMDETRIGRHAIGLNHLSIGVENVGGHRGYPLTDAQVAANIALVRDLAARFPITHLIGHYEYRQMEGHPYFRERDPTYRTHKQDPGESFMERVRAGVSDLGLQGPPTAQPR